MEQSSRLKAPGADPDTGYQIFSEIKSTVLKMSFMEQSSRLKAPGADPDTGYQIFSEIKSTVLKKISSILSELLELRLWS